jgi:hypothetical protein
MGVVSGTISFEDGSDKPPQLSFGTWMLRTIKAEAGKSGWSYSGNEEHFYLWENFLEAEGKTSAHFLDKEHLHLINKGNDIAISTKHPQPEVIKAGVSQKRTAADKVPQHLTGTKAVNAGESPPISLCTKDEPPADVIEWQKDLIETLRELALARLRAVGSPQQIKEFLA